MKLFPILEMNGNLAGFSLNTIRNERKVSGYFTVIVAAILSASVHIIAKPVVEDMNFSNSISLAMITYLINFIFFVPLTQKSMPIKKIQPRDWIILAIMGITDASALACYFVGLGHSTATNASIFGNGEIVFSLIIATVVFRERLGKSEYLPFALIITGVLLIPITTEIVQDGFSQNGFTSGDLFLMLTGVFYSTTICMSRLLSTKIDSKRLTQITFLAATITSFGFLFLFKLPFGIESQFIVEIIIFSIAGIGVAYALFFSGLRKIGAMKSVLLYSTNSIIGIILAALFLSEIISIENIISVGMTIFSLFLLRKKISASYEGEIKC